MLPTKKVAKEPELKEQENHWISTIYGKLFIDRNKINTPTKGADVVAFINNCNSKNWSSIPYNRETLNLLQKIMDRALADKPFKIKVLPMKISIGDFVMKEIFCKDENFYIEIKYDKREIKAQMGSNPKTSETLLFNEINSSFPKDLRGGTGVFSL